MYEDCHGMCYSKAWGPVGKQAASKDIRWMDARTDAMVNQLQQAVSLSAQKRAVCGLEKIRLDQLPGSALWYGGRRFEYSTKHAVGWPSKQHPYAGPGDDLIILTHLRPAP